jgi:hypothetical protein
MYYMEHRLAWDIVIQWGGRRDMNEMWQQDYKSKVITTKSRNKIAIHKGPIDAQKKLKIGGKKREWI